MPYIEWTEAPECPHCGAEYDDPDSLKMEDDDEQVVHCLSCNDQYQVTARVTSEYSTRPWTELDQAKKELRRARVTELFMRKLCEPRKNWDGMTEINDRTLAAERRVAELRKEALRTKREALVHPSDCRCGGAGWVWRHELPDTSDWDGSADDTQYSCPYRELEVEP